jgi:hypothetical protein
MYRNGHKTAWWSRGSFPGPWLLLGPFCFWPAVLVLGQKCFIAILFIIVIILSFGAVLQKTKNLLGIRQDSRTILVKGHELAGVFICDPRLIASTVD